MDRNNSPGGQTSDPDDTSHVVSRRPQLRIHSSHTPSLRRTDENPFNESLLGNAVLPRRNQRLIERRTGVEGSFPTDQSVTLVWR